MSLKHKFLVIGAATSLLTIMLAIMSIIGVSQFTGLIEESESASSALRNHLTGDMMHDGLRSDVYRALYAAENAPQDREDVLNDVREHSQEFRDRIAANVHAIPWWFVAAGVTTSIALLSQFSAFAYLPAWVVGILQATQGIWAIGLGMVFLKGDEHVDWHLMASVALVVSGVVLIGIQ